MSKTYIKSLRFLPQSYNFSEFEFEGGKALGTALAHNNNTLTSLDLSGQ